MAVQLSQIKLAWHTVALSDADVYPLDVLAIVLGEGKSSRLYQQVRQKQGLVHAVSATSYTPLYPGLFLIEAVADRDKRDAAIAAIRAEVSKLASDTVGQDELQKSIKISLSHHLDQLRTVDGQARDLAESEIMTGDPNFSETYLANLRRVTTEDVRRVARQYLADRNLTIATLNPLAGPAQAPAPPAAPAAVQIQEFRLANGLRLLVREDHSLPLVNIQALLLGGVRAESETNSGITRLTARLLLKGTRTRSADQIATTIESVGGQISYFAGNSSCGLSAHALSEDVGLALDLVSDVLQNATFPPRWSSGSGPPSWPKSKKNKTGSFRSRNNSCASRCTPNTPTA